MRKIIALMILMWIFPCWAERVKDLAAIQGIRSNQLVGYGLVVGLDGTGDTEDFTKQSFINMLNKLGVTIPPGTSPKIKNVAAVALNAELPAFSKPGQKVDVTISSLGDAKSLKGGTLLLAPLKGLDGEVYAIAQGNLVVGGISAEGEDKSKVTINVPSVGRIPNGALIERAVPSPFLQTDVLIFNLHRSDFTTVTRLSEAINQYIGPTTATPLDGTSVKVHMPVDLTDKVAFVSAIENLEISPAEMLAKIVINSRTGTIVIGKHVTVGPAAIAHGSLVVTVTERSDVSQPNAFSTGTTEVTPRSDITIKQENVRLFAVDKSVTLDTIVSALNRIGATPDDLIAILEALKQAGALNAEVQII